MKDSTCISWQASGQSFFLVEAVIDGTTKLLRIVTKVEDLSLVQQFDTYLRACLEEGWIQANQWSYGIFLSKDGKIKCRKAKSWAFLQFNLSHKSSMFSMQPCLFLPNWPNTKRLGPNIQLSNPFLWRKHQTRATNEAAY